MAGKTTNRAAAKKTAKKSAKVAKKVAAKRVAAKPTLLAGGNPQIAKADGDAPEQAYIAAMPGWKRDVGRRLDALIVRTVPDVRKAVKWNSPFYGIEGQGWFLNFHCFTKYVKVAFFRGTSLRPLLPGVQAQGSALPRHPRGRQARRGARGELDSAGIGAARLGPVAQAGILASSPSRHRAATRPLAPVVPSASWHSPPDACRWFTSLTFEDPNERLGGSEHVVDWMMIVLRPSQPFPLLSVPEITDQSGVEVGNAPTRMPERVLADITPEVEVDPLEVVRRIVRNEDHRHPRRQPFPELTERVLRAIGAVERLDPTVLKGVDVNGAKLRHVAD
jgi:hypothetical protein